MEQIHDTNQSTSAALPKRLNIYSNIHKALRAFMCDTLTAVSSMDGDDLQELDTTLSQARTLADFCQGHLEHENEFLHTALEARRPGSSGTTAGDHEHHVWAIEKLHSLIDAVEQAGSSERDEAINQLRSYLAIFIAENLTHMNVEETENNAVLWATHTDAELRGIEHALVSSLPPEETAIAMRWMLPALNHTERTELLTGMKLHAPKPVFEGVLAIARSNLSEANWNKLVRSLALPDRLAA